MKSIANPTIFSVKPYIPGKPIDEVKRELGVRDVIKLASNENPYPPSPMVRRAIAVAGKEVNRYPDGGCFHLRQMLSQRLKVSEEQLIFGNGSDEVIVMAVRAFVNPGDEVVIAKPSFLIYSIASKLAGGQVKEIPLKDLRYDLDAMQKAVTKKTKIVFLGNPDNPSGHYLTHTDLLRFIKSIPAKVVVFIDEAYFEFVRANDYADSLKLLKQFPNVIVTRTFSKMYGLAGLRIGYGVARADVIELLNRVREPFNVNSIAQAAAMACLKDDRYYRLIADKIEKQRNYLYQQFTRLKLSYQQSWTNFILVKINQDSTVVTQKLMKKGVIIRDMNVWGLSNTIRVTIGTPAENRKLVSALEDVL